MLFVGFFQETYGSFHYTSLLYLTTYNQDFTGGRFVFVDKGRNTTVEPKLGKWSTLSFSLSVCVCVHVCVCVCVCVCMSVYMCASCYHSLYHSLCMCVYVCVCACVIGYCFFTHNLLIIWIEWLIFLLNWIEYESFFNVWNNKNMKWLYHMISNKEMFTTYRTGLILHVWMGKSTFCGKSKKWDTLCHHSIVYLWSWQSHRWSHNEIDKRQYMQNIFIEMID